MKTESLTRRISLASICILLLAFVYSTKGYAQSSQSNDSDAEGIVVYSDTSGTASTDSYRQDETTDNADQTDYPDSTWSAASPAGMSIMMNSDALSHPFRVFGNLFHNMLGIGLVLSLILTALLFIIPLLLIAALIYLIIRLTRTGTYKPRPGDPPLTPEEISMRQKQQVIRLASIGVALLLIEWFFGFGHIAGIVGIVLLCIAAGQWFSSRR